MVAPDGLLGAEERVQLGALHVQVQQAQPLSGPLVGELPQWGSTPGVRVVAREVGPMGPSMHGHAEPSCAGLLRWKNLIIYSIARGVQAGAGLEPSITRRSKGKTGNQWRDAKDVALAGIGLTASGGPAPSLRETFEGLNICPAYNMPELGRIMLSLRPRPAWIVTRFPRCPYVALIERTFAMRGSTACTLRHGAACAYKQLSVPTWAPASTTLPGDNSGLESKPTRIALKMGSFLMRHVFVGLDIGDTRRTRVSPHVLTG